MLLRTLGRINVHDIPHVSRIRSRQSEAVLHSQTYRVLAAEGWIKNGDAEVFLHALLWFYQSNVEIVISVPFSSRWVSDPTIVTFMIDSGFYEPRMLVAVAVLYYQI